MALATVSFAKPLAHQPRLTKPYVPGRHSETYWRDEELQIIRDHYPTGGVVACVAHLPGRTESSVYGMASKLGLRVERLSETRERRSSSPELDARIVEHWRLLNGQKKGEVQALATKLGVPRWWLTKQATRLGLTMPHRKEPKWTEAELALMVHVPLHDLNKAASMFREHGFARTPSSIQNRARRMKLSRRSTREELSASKIAKILGVDAKWVTACIVAGELPATKREDRRLPQQGGSSWDVKPADLRKFLIDHLERIDFRKVEKFSFVDILTSEDVASLSDLAF